MLRSHLHAACASTRAAALLQLPAFHIRHHSVGVMTPSLGDAKLTDVDTDAVISGRELWNERPCVVLAFRRPGCGGLPSLLTFAHLSTPAATRACPQLESVIYAVSLRT